MKRALRTFVAVLTVAATSAHSEAAPGAASDAAPVRPRTVEVWVSGPADDELDGALRELLARLDLAVEIRRVSSAASAASAAAATPRPDLLARVAIDGRPDGDTAVVVLDARGAIVARRTLHRDGPPAVFREELAHVVQSAVDPLVLAAADESARPAPTPPPAAPPPAAGPPPSAAPPVSAPIARAEAPAPPPDAPPSWALDVVTTAGAASFASDALLVGRVGASVHVAHRRGLSPSLTASGHYGFPFEVGDALVKAHTSAVTVRVVPAIEVVHMPWLAIDLGVGGGFDHLRVEPTSLTLPADRLGAATTRVDAMATAALSAHVPVAVGTTITMSLAADYDLADRSYVLARGAARTELLAPWRVRPSLLLGFAFTAAGKARFAVAR